MGLREPGDRQAVNEAKARGGRVVAVGTTSLRLLESAAREDGTAGAVLGRHRDLHHPRLPLQGRRCPDDQFPPAAFDPVHAGLGLCRHGRMRGPTNTLSNAATASTPTETAACCSGTMFGRTVPASRLTQDCAPGTSLPSLMQIAIRILMSTDQFTFTVSKTMASHVRARSGCRVGSSARRPSCRWARPRP